MKNNNTTHVVTLLIEELRAPVTRQSISEELQKHPDYPGLLAISEVLSNWKIPNAPYELTAEELADVPCPFIVFLLNGEFALVSSFNEKEVIVSTENFRHRKITFDYFKKNYQGTVLAVEKDELSGEPDYGAKRRNEIINSLRIPLITTASAIIFIAFLLFNPSYTAAFNRAIAFLTFFKTAGVIVSILLLIQSIDSANPMIQKLCGGDGNANCNAILSSKAAKISAELSWSEAGFFYFAGTWLVLLFNSGNSNLMLVLAFLNLISLPYTFYSIYYQWRIAEQWCIFCCAVQAILWFEFFCFLPYLQLYGIQHAGLGEWASLLMIMAIPVLMWVFIKPYLLEAVQLQPVKKQLRDFKYNADLFNNGLSNEIKYSLPAEEDSIILGNREAKTVLTMVSNPYCNPCSRAHKTFDEWLDNRNDIKLQLIFTPPDKKDPKWQVANHLMSLRNANDETSLKQALNDWYSKKYRNFEIWAKHHPVKNLQFNSDPFQKQFEWFKTANITGTPTVFINGRKLPQNYQPEDIKYFI